MSSTSKRRRKPKGGAKKQGKDREKARRKEIERRLKVTEEQEQELEALEAIYGPSFVRLDGLDTYEYPFCFKIKTVPHPGDDASNHISVWLKVQFPREYPAEAPHCAFLDPVGLSVQSLAELQKLVDTEAAQLLGDQMVYNLVDVIQEWLVTHNKESVSSSHAEMERNAERLQAAEEKEKTERRAAQQQQHAREDLQRQKQAHLDTLRLEEETELREQWLKRKQKEVAEQKQQQQEQEQQQHQQQLEQPSGSFVASPSSPLSNASPSRANVGSPSSRRNKGKKKKKKKKNKQRGGMGGDAKQGAQSPPPTKLFPTPGDDDKDDDMAKLSLQRSASDPLPDSSQSGGGDPGSGRPAGRGAVGSAAGGTTGGGGGVDQPSARRGKSVGHSKGAGADTSQTYRQQLMIIHLLRKYLAVAQPMATAQQTAEKANPNKRTSPAPKAGRKGGSARGGDVVPMSTLLRQLSETEVLPPSVTAVLPKLAPINAAATPVSSSSSAAASPTSTTTTLLASPVEQILQSDAAFESEFRRAFGNQIEQVRTGLSSTDSSSDPSAAVYRHFWTPGSSHDSKLLSRTTSAESSSSDRQNSITQGGKAKSSESSRYLTDFDELQLLGRGSFGEVVKVRNRLDGRYYAIKKVRLRQSQLEDAGDDRFDLQNAPDADGTNSVLARMLREVTTLARLHHPYVLRYYQAFLECDEDDETDNGTSDSNVHPAKKKKKKKAGRTKGKRQPPRPVLGSLSSASRVGGVPSADTSSGLMYSQGTSEDYPELGSLMHSASMGTGDPDFSRHSLFNDDDVDDDDGTFGTFGTGNEWSADVHGSSIGVGPSIARASGDSLAGGWESGTGSARPTPNVGALLKLSRMEDQSHPSPSLAGMLASMEPPKLSEQKGNSDTESSSGSSPPVKADNEEDFAELFQAGLTLDQLGASGLSLPSKSSVLSGDESDRDDEDDAAPEDDEEEEENDLFAEKPQPMIRQKSASRRASRKFRKRKPTILYIQTEYCEKTLREVIRKEAHGMDPGEIWHRCRQMIEGLVHIHGQRIIHRDLKPSNIFIDSSGDVKIGDFGLATFGIIDKRGNASTSVADQEVKVGDSQMMPQTNAAGADLTSGVGTFFYTSPEQRDGVEYDEKVDLFALGIVFFEMWHPFSTAHERYQILSALRDRKEFPPGFEESHPRQVQIIKWLIKDDPRERPFALELLRSSLLPPKMEDEYMKDAVRTLANPHTSFYHRLVDALFDPSRPLPLTLSGEIDDPIPSGGSASGSKGGPDVASRSHFQANRRQQLQVFHSYHHMGGIPKSLHRLPLEVACAPIVVCCRDAVLQTVASVFQRHSAIRIGTPLFEAPTLTRAANLAGRFELQSLHDAQQASGIQAADHIDRIRRQIVRFELDTAVPADAALFTDRAGLLVHLRYDLRVPFAHHVVRYGVAPLRRYHVGTVFRARVPRIMGGSRKAAATGRAGGTTPLEILQADFDIVGTRAPSTTNVVALLADAKKQQLEVDTSGGGGSSAATTPTHQQTTPVHRSSPGKYGRVANSSIKTGSVGHAGSSAGGSSVTGAAPNTKSAFGDDTIATDAHVAQLVRSMPHILEDAETVTVAAEILRAFEEPMEEMEYRSMAIKLCHTDLIDAILAACGVPLTFNTTDRARTESQSLFAKSAASPAASPPPSSSSSTSSPPSAQQADNNTNVTTLNVRRRVRRVLLHLGRQTLSWPTVRTQLRAIPGVTDRALDKLESYIFVTSSKTSGKGSQPAHMYSPQHRSPDHNLMLLNRWRDLFHDDSYVMCLLAQLQRLLHFLELFGLQVRAPSAPDQIADAAAAGRAKRRSQTPVCVVLDPTTYVDYYYTGTVFRAEFEWMPSVTGGSSGDVPPSAMAGSSAASSGGGTQSASGKSIPRRRLSEAVAVGGRYDELLSYVSDSLYLAVDVDAADMQASPLLYQESKMAAVTRRLGGVGLSVAIEKLVSVKKRMEQRRLAALQQQHMDAPTVARSNGVFVCSVGQDMLSERMRLCAELWAAGVQARYMCGEHASLAEQLDAAISPTNNLAPRWLVVMKDRVLGSAGTVRVKNLEKKTEVDVPRSEVVRYISPQQQSVSSTPARSRKWR